MNTTEENEPAKSRFRNHFTKESIKGHFRRNGKLYIGLGVGAVAVLLASNRREVQTTVRQIGFRNTQTTVLVPRGHPGYLVRWVETGEIAASQNRMAKLAEVPPSQLSKHLNGQLPHVKDNHFERLGQAR